LSILGFVLGIGWQPIAHAQAAPPRRGKPQRITYRDFSLWPAGPLATETDETRAAFKRTQKQQLDHMWEQTQP
jgi:hypothetical protein